ncbi:MAG TPA: hypothetical protein VFW45_07010 [Candidatus Polarisedimenticolia bacterium]|nr:hypothetical protein [Candidatus Polarisedimenticolia bacterium]
MFEHRRQRLLDPRAFALRMARHGVWAMLLILFSLIFGTLGFFFCAGLPWIDSFLNASMLLAGMGPVGDMGPPLGKVFASLYALYSGLIFLIVAGLLSAPVFHRMLHRFHLDGEEDKRR